MSNEKNCPFYGRSLFRPSLSDRGLPFLLLNQHEHGNQCALITDHYAPCHMETYSLAVDWRECPTVREVRLS